MNYKMLLLTFIFLLYLFSGTTFATMVSPSNFDGGNLVVGTTYNHSFILRNLNTYTLNATFELTPSSESLSSYVTFNPSQINSLSPDNQQQFNVSIRPTSSIPNGNYSLIFRPVISIVEEISDENTGNITVTTYLLTSSAASINFSFQKEEAVSAPVALSSASAAVTPITRKVKYENLTIELPWIVRATEPSVLVKIKIKNTGNVSLENLKINLFSKSPMNLDYYPYIGALIPNEEKEVGIRISNLDLVYNFINVSVFNEKNIWTAGFLVYNPHPPTALVSKDCIVIEPEEFRIIANKKSVINLTLKNTCDTDIHNLNVIFSPIQKVKNITYIENIEKINTLGQTSIGIDIELPVGTFYYVLTSGYNEGESTTVIRIKSVNVLYYYILFGVVVIIVFILRRIYEKQSALINQLKLSLRKIKQKKPKKDKTKFIKNALTNPFK